MTWDKINSENLAMGRLKCKLRQVGIKVTHCPSTRAKVVRHWAALYCYLVFTLVRGCNQFSKGQMRWERVNLKSSLFCCKDRLRPFSAVRVISQWSSNLGLLLLVQITQRLMVMAAFTQKNVLSISPVRFVQQNQ